ncbi:CD5 antigen-like [Kryptolebias marmoratus]|uniref:CD5 antigen-like n=1 Tax=Kryptolebias marmoratus TaxID=37003 RepID=UPI0018ACE749|nr:CD5 antigen-like [Kryptolebias marmoratus]
MNPEEGLYDLVVISFFLSVKLSSGAAAVPDSVRLLNGTSLCSGRLEVKSSQSSQSKQSWSSVCEADFDLQDAQVVCRELGCGPPSVLQGALYGEVEAPMWTTEFQCGGHESALLDCRSSGSARNTCSPGKAVGLTCSASSSLNLTCSDSVRLLNGTSLCSGRLEVKSSPSSQSKQSWSSVCEADFDLQDAQVVCRELGCGPPSVLQGALYGEVEAPKWTTEFQCGGHESALLDCRSSGSARNTCSPGKAVGLTCSEPVRLVGGASRCSGDLELKHLGGWTPVDGFDWTLKTAAVVCEHLDCGSAVSVGQRWKSSSTPDSSPSSLTLTCSDLLVQPIISVSSMNGVSDAQQQGFQVSRGSSFTISCSIQPQYPGGSFQLSFTSSNTPHSYIQPAVNHSAHFLFPAAEPAHQGRYSCVYNIHVFSHNFSSESRGLSLTVSDATVLLIRAVVLPLTLLVVNAGLYFYWKASRRQKWSRQENMELVVWNIRVSAAEEEGAQGAEENLRELLSHPDEFLSCHRTNHQGYHHQEGLVSH